jgi:hypothetical protein
VIGDPPPSPVGPIERQLLDLHKLAASCIHASTSSHGYQLGPLLQLDVDIREWEKQLQARPEIALLSNARRELGFATYSASSGLYLQAFSSLRLFLELSFAAVNFSIDELLRRQWWADRAKFSWSKALDAENGLLAEPMLREFMPSATIDAISYSARAAECYDHCSSFLHGKIVATNHLPKTISYSKDVMTDWCRTARAAAEAVLYLLYCRFGGELLGRDDGRLAATLEHSFGHLPTIRKAIGLPVDEETPRAQ